MRNQQVKFLLILIWISILSVCPLHQTQHRQLHVNHFQTNQTQPIKKQDVQSIIESINSQIDILNLTLNQINNQKDESFIAESAKVQKCKQVSAQTGSVLAHAKLNLQQDYTNLFFKADLYRKTYQDPVAFISDQQKILKKIQTLDQKYNFVACPQQSQQPQPTQNQLQIQGNEQIADLSKHIFVSNIVSDPNWVWGNQTETQYELNQYNLFLQNDLALCPQVTPFASSNGLSCIKCPVNSTYNLQLYKCQACKNGTKFNEEQHVCEIITKNNCDSNQIYVEVTKKCQCPADRPFFDGSSCISCYIPSFWSKDTGKCEQCSSGQYFSLSTGQCQKCKSDQFSDSISCQRQCTLQNPYFNGNNCISCKYLFNQNTDKCEDCQEGLIFDLNKKVCSKTSGNNSVLLNCEDGYVFNPSNSQCVKKQPCECPQNYIFNEELNKCQCPKSMPYDSGKKCVQCNAPQYWNTSKKSCLNCEKNQFYSLKDKKCVSCPSQTPLKDQNNQCKACPSGTVYNSLSISCESSQHYCPKTFVWSKQKSKCVCPSDKPVQTDKGCSSNCSYPLVWSTELSQCVTQSQNNQSNIHICKFGQIYNQTQKQCVCTAQNPYKTSQGCINCYGPMKWSQKDQRCIYSTNNTNNTTNLCKSNYIFDSSLNICVCPPQFPFNSGNQCVSCYLPMYWSHTQKMCLYCPQNQFFNTFNRRCQYCPSEKPKLENYACVSCPIGTSYNLISKQCQNVNCLGGSSYSVQRNQCSCPTAQTPFYNGRTCVQCKYPNRWDITTKRCVVNTVSQPVYISPVSISPIPISSSASFNSYVSHLKEY